MKVHWTENAENHLDAIHNYIAQNSPEYARIIVDRLTKRSERISDYPLSGRIVPEITTPQIREILEGRYRIIYYIKPDQIDVLAVLHSAMNSLGKNAEHNSSE